MNKKNPKKQKVGFRPIVGAIRYTIKDGKKIKRLDVIKARVPTN